MVPLATYCQTFKRLTEREGAHPHGGRAGANSSVAGAGAGSDPLPPPYGSPFRLPPATNRVDGLASSVGGTAAAVAAVSNPFLSGSGGAAAGVASYYRYVEQGK
jgi:hypothetical protein